MAKKKKEEKDETEIDKVEEDFNLEAALKNLDPYLQTGFRWYIKEKSLNITNQKEFDKYVKHYGGL